MTFYFKDKTNISKTDLNSILNFKFSFLPILVNEYGYTGNYETFIAPYDGLYKIELWGASGGNNKTYRITAEGADRVLSERSASFIGGYGGYTSGEIRLNSGDNLFVYVGEMGKRNLQLTFNGGGSGGIGGTGYHGTNPSGDIALVGHSGSGATDVRLINGLWNDFESLKSRIIVAAGGGGSSFISGHNGCNAIFKISTASNIVHLGSSNHYSGYVFSNTLMIDGYGYSWTTKQDKLYVMPSYAETLTTSGNLGDVYAKITFISE